jgi:hypothetical protein
MFSKPVANSDLIAARRKKVLASYTDAEQTNALAFLEGDSNATQEFIFDNQKQDALRVVHEFCNNDRRVVSITKKTKVGMDGLMIEIAYQMTTHADDNFVIDPKNVRFLTGMSNTAWQTDMKEKIPSVFTKNVFHHGQLKRADLSDLRNALIIIDEIDTGDKIGSVLNNLLRDAGLLNIHNMIERNIRFVFVSATMLKQLYELKDWGEHHATIQMTIPEQYIGHTDFKAEGIIQEFYPLATVPAARRWIKEDIIEKYGTDYRVHMVRVTNKTIGNIMFVSKEFPSVVWHEHNSEDRADIAKFFEAPIDKHVILFIKGFFRRANLIPNKWKLRIGAMHELWTKKVDNNVQIQGFPGRMSGYWADDIHAGHKTGPYRTSCQAVDEYEQSFNDPFGDAAYSGGGIIKTAEHTVAIKTDSLVSPSNIEGIDTHATTTTTTTHKTVPIVVQVTAEEYARIKRIGGTKEWDVTSIIEVIKDKIAPELIHTINRIIDDGGKDQIVEQKDTTTATYAEYIDKSVNAANDNKPHWRTGNIKDKDRDLLQIYLDWCNHRIIVCIYRGTHGSPRTPPLV